MKRFALILALALIFTLTACENGKKSVDESSDSDSIEYMKTECNKDSVEEFLSALSNVELGGFMSYYPTDEEHCYNVTPIQVKEQTNIQIFKFSNSCLSLAYINGEIFEICASFGGHGFVNAVPCDYDSDGNIDLLVASSWGSGLHRSEISLFDSATKQSTVIFSTAETETPDLDLVLTTQTPSSDIASDEIYCQVHTVKMNTTSGNFADLSYTITGAIGTVKSNNGVPQFIAIKY